MKKICSIVFIVFLSFVVEGVLAQTYIHIYTDMSFYNIRACNKTMSLGLQLDMSTSGYPGGSTYIIKASFGDGIDSIFNSQLNDHPWSVTQTIYHHYSDTGIYHVKFKVIAPDNKADSVVYDHFIVGDVCENLEGVVYIDNDNSCTYNSGDVPINYALVNLWNNSEIIQTDTISPSHNGSMYNFSVPKEFNYKVSVNNNFGSTFCPPFYDIISGPYTNRDFGFYCDNNDYDLTGSLVGHGNYNPGTLIHIACMAINIGCGSVSGKLKLKYDATRLVFSSATPPFIQSGDTIIWNFSNLDSYIITQAMYSPLANFHVATSAISGDTIKLKLLETPLINDLNITNNTQDLYRIVSASYDPNEKYVLPQGKGSEGFINNNTNMVYTVTFQNTGTATAQNIYIIDTVDSNLDLTSFALLNHSHDPQVTFHNGGVIKFNYPNINLPDSHSNHNTSIGFVQFALKQKADLAELSQIKNKCYIYFDYNAPVKTNTVLNTINYVGVSINENTIKNNYFSVYPNPNTGSFNLLFENPTENKIIEVYNISGQLILSNKFTNDLVKTIDLSGQAKGVYLLKVKTDNYTSSEKIILE